MISSALIVAASLLGGCDNDGAEPARVRAAGAQVFQCERIDNNQSAAEAQPSFSLHLEGETVLIKGVEIADSCAGKKRKTPKKFVGQFQKFDVGGSTCAADGYNALVEHALFTGVARGLVLIEANEDTDYYLCSKPARR